MIRLVQYRTGAPKSNVEQRCSPVSKDSSPMSDQVLMVGKIITKVCGQLRYVHWATQCKVSSKIVLVNF